MRSDRARRVYWHTGPRADARAANRYAEATLGSGNLRLAVILPEGEDLSEWLAVNSQSDCLAVAATASIAETRGHAAVDFFNQINMLYGTITEFCSKEECPVMSAGQRSVQLCFA